MILYMVGKNLGRLEKFPNCSWVCRACATQWLMVACVREQLLTLPTVLEAHLGLIQCMVGFCGGWAASSDACTYTSSGQSSLS